jgi:hypothetical protein
MVSFYVIFIMLKIWYICKHKCPDLVIYVVKSYDTFESAWSVSFYITLHVHCITCWLIGYSLDSCVPRRKNSSYRFIILRKYVTYGSGNLPTLTASLYICTWWVQTEYIKAVFVSECLLSQQVYYHIFVLY